VIAANGVGRVGQVCLLNVRETKERGVRSDDRERKARDVVSLVTQGCSVAQLARHLEELRTDAIGLEADPERDNEIANEIVEALLADALQQAAPTDRLRGG
jgi:hypothetical protein